MKNMVNPSNKYCIKEFAFIPPPYGGVSTYIKRLITRLNELGYITGGYYLPQCKDLYVRNSVLFDEWKWLPPQLFIPRILKYIHEAKPYSIVHSHFSLEGMLYLWTLKVFCRKRIVVTVHNSMVEGYLSKTNFLNRFFLKKMTESPDVTWIAVSEQAKASMLNLPLSFGSRIHVIPAYIPLIANDKNDLPLELRQYIDTHNKIIVFYGHSFMKHDDRDVYGFSMALSMFGSLSETEKEHCGFVVCIANSSEKSLTELRELAASLGIDDKVYWQIGAIDNMAALWSCTDVYIRPTSTDGDSVAVREALDMGAQVVASDVCQRPEGVVTYSYGDNQLFVEAVREALSRGKGAPNNDETYFNQMFSIYKRILDE